MKSSASIKGHPIHPLLIAFPVAFFTGTLIFDILSVIFDNTSFREAGKYLEIAGIIGGLLAAVPGLIDFLWTVPPKSSAKKRGARHGLINTSVIIIFAIALALRQSAEVSITWIIVPEIIGFILLCIAGWMGGVLVYRNQIGINPRYAEAGKWKETYIKVSSTTPVFVAGMDELKINQMKLVHVRKNRIVIAKTETGYVAFDDHCTHKGGSLAGGAMICGTVQCPWHGSQFDVQNGKVKAGPAQTAINTYGINEQDGKVFLLL